MSPSSDRQPPEVSVLMSCHNASRWLCDAIESVLAQTFENFEFILVNDGSTDETWNIIQNYRDHDRRIIAVSKESTGLTDSLNVGIRQARGVWIARLDADDLCEPTRLEEQLRYVRENRQIVLLGTGFVEIDEHGRSIKNHLPVAAHRGLVRHLERAQAYFPHSSAFFKRDAAKAAGCYNHLFQKSQDRDLWLRFSERGRIACLQNCLVRIRKHSQQISTSTAGMSQRVYGTAAAACHFLRIRCCPDPSGSNDEIAWVEFLAWVERRIAEDGFIARRKAWAEARAEYFSNKNGLTDLLRFAIRIFESGYVIALVREKLFGFSLPEHLAGEWIKRAPGAS